MHVVHDESGLVIRDVLQLLSPLGVIAVRVFCTVIDSCGQDIRDQQKGRQQQDLRLEYIGRCPFNDESIMNTQIRECGSNKLGFGFCFWGGAVGS